MASRSSTPWALDPQLAADTVAVGDLPLSRLLLHSDANYPWLILAPRRAGAIELTDLDATDRVRLMEEIAQTSAALSTITRCHKINVAALGNVVAQLHVHVIARFRDDAAWPGPVWGKAPARAYDPPQRDAIAARLRSELALDLVR